MPPVQLCNARPSCLELPFAVWYQAQHDSLPYIQQWMSDAIMHQPLACLGELTPRKAVRALAEQSYLPHPIQA